MSANCFSFWGRPPDSLGYSPLNENSWRRRWIQPDRSCFSYCVRNCVKLRQLRYFIVYTWESSIPIQSHVGGLESHEIGIIYISSNCYQKFNAILTSTPIFSITRYNTECFAMQFRLVPSQRYVICFLPREQLRQRGISCRKSVCLSVCLFVRPPVCLSVCHTCALWQNQTMHCGYFDKTRKGNHSRVRMRS